MAGQIMSCNIWLVISIASPSPAIDCLRHRIRGALLDQTQEEAPVSSDQPAVQQCPKCHGPMRIIERLTVEEIKNPERSPLLAVDTS